MADFSTAWKISAKNESGYANVKGDAGGMTYRGISRVYNPQWAGWSLIDMFISLSGEPKNGFTNDQWDILANQFYKTNYWDKLKLDDVQNQDNANQIYDHSLSGLGRTVSMVKEVLNQKFSQSLGTTTTMDDATVNALNSVSASDFFNEFKKAREDFFKYSANTLSSSDSTYFNLFKRFNSSPNSSNEQFLNGWLNRVNSYVYTGIDDVKSLVKNNPIKTGGIILGISIISFLIYKYYTNNG